MKPLLRLLCYTLFLSVSTSAAFAADTLIVGVAPHTSARIILEMYQPLRLSLEKSLAMPVEIVTATDFNAFAKSAMAQDYDIAITTGHQARLLQTDAKYMPLLTYKADFKAVAIVAANSPIRKARDLKGKNVLGLSAASLVTLWGQHWLVDNGLGSIRVKYVSASDSVAQLVVAGEAAAGFVSLANFQKLSPAVKSQLRILASSKSMTGRVYMLNSKRASGHKAISSALWAFAATPEGIRYFESNNLGGYRKLGQQELKSMDKYAAEVKRLLPK